MLSCSNDCDDQQYYPEEAFRYKIINNTGVNFTSLSLCSYKDKTSKTLRDCDFIENLNDGSETEIKKTKYKYVRIIGYRIGNGNVYKQKGSGVFDPDGYISHELKKGELNIISLK